MSVMLRKATVGVLLVLATGCSAVTSAQPGATNTTGEAWYVRTSYFLALPIGTDVYYCSKDNPARCTKAQIVEAGSAAPSAE
jgi:hypothetical protein